MKIFQKICVIWFIVSVAVLLIYLKEPFRGKRYADVTFSDVLQNDNTSYPSAVVNINLHDYQKNNIDVYAYMVIPDTNISYPIVLRNFDDSVNLRTTKYNTTQFIDRNVCIYANPDNNPAYEDFYKYADSTFLDNHQKMYILTEQGIIVYDVLMSGYMDGKNIFKKYDFSLFSGLQAYLQDFTDRRAQTGNYDSYTIDEQSCLITVMVCDTEDEAKYWIVVALKENET